MLEINLINRIGTEKIMHTRADDRIEIIGRARQRSKRKISRTIRSNYKSSSNNPTNTILKLMEYKSRAPRNAHNKLFGTTADKIRGANTST